MAELKLDTERAALCIVEMQNDIIHESNVGVRGIGGVLAAQVQKRGVLAKLQAVIAAARARRVPILYINMCSKPGFPRPNTLLHRRSGRKPMLIEGTWGAEIHEGIAATPEDYVLERRSKHDCGYVIPGEQRLGLLAVVNLEIGTKGTTLRIGGGRQPSDRALPGHTGETLHL